MKNTTFHFTTQVGKPAIEIRFADKSFLSCVTGTDLADLDDLLRYFIPSLDLEQLNYANARYLEQELYRWLSGCQSRESAAEVFENFCAEVAEKYARRPDTARGGHQGPGFNFSLDSCGYAQDKL